MAGEFSPITKEKIICKIDLLHQKLLIDSFFFKFLIKFLRNIIKYIVSRVVSGALKVLLLRATTTQRAF